MNSHQIPTNHYECEVLPVNDNSSFFLFSLNLLKHKYVRILIRSLILQKYIQKFFDYKYQIGDMTPPEIEFDIENQTAIITCTDPESGIKSGAKYTQHLTGNKDITIDHLCINNADISTKKSHTYKYYSCLKGENTCQGANVCKNWERVYDDCAYEIPNSEGGYTCDPDYVLTCTGGYYWNSCASGSNNCVGGFKLN